MESSPTPADSQLETHLQLKRIFLRALIVSLVTCALVAVGVLLFGTFNRTTGRILGTLVVLAVHSGIAMACADSLERRWWPGLSRIGLIAFTINFVWFLLVIWGRDRYVGEQVGTTFALIGYYLASIPPFVLCGRRRWRWLAETGRVLCAVSLLMGLSVIWFERDVGDIWERWTAVFVVLAASISHTCLLGLVRSGGAIWWVLRGTLVCVWVLAVLVSGAILADSEDELLIRFIAAVAVLDVCGNLSLVILSRLNKVADVQKIETSDKQIEIICPRCAKQQLAPAGRSECGECGLRFRIEIEEPRCPRCGYLLWQLPEKRCPECGREF